MFPRRSPVRRMLSLRRPGLFFGDDLPGERISLLFCKDFVVSQMKRDFIGMIEERMPEFSKGQKRIAQYIISNYDNAAYMTASRLGALVNVSESTVVRFANALGFEGYPEMQKAMQDFIRTKLTTFQRIEVTNKLIGDGDLLEKVLGSDIDNIKRTCEELDRESFNAAIDALLGARRIYIIGVRSSSTIAGFLNYNLRMIFDDVRFLQTSSGSELFEQLIDITDKDVLFAISFPRYSKRVINAVEYVKRSGADIIALTDSMQSPIATYSDQALLARSDMASFVDSLAAPLSVINALIVALTKRKQDNMTEKLRRLESVWDEYDVYDKSQS